jgi:predicted metal-dependent hydrolase
LSKSDRVAELLVACGKADARHDPHYSGYFACFNQQLYYEAHDVLEALWLPRRHLEDGNFYKGLIQLAGAFVHLKKGRLKPASNLFALAEANLLRYPPVHHDFALGDALSLCTSYRAQLAASGFANNPWSEVGAPRLALRA